MSDAATGKPSGPSVVCPYVSTFSELPSPAGLDVAGGRLYVSADVFADGSIVSFPVP